MLPWNAGAYAVNCGAGALLVFNAPLTPSSTPAEVQTQLLVVDEGASKLFVFDLPIKSCSVPSAVVTAVAAADVLQNNLFISGTGTVVQRFTLPLTSASAAQTFAYPTEAGSPNAYGMLLHDAHRRHSVVSSPQRLTLDDAGNLFVADSQKGIVVLSESSGYQLASVIVAAQGADAAIHNIRGVAIGP